MGFVIKTGFPVYSKIAALYKSEQIVNEHPLEGSGRAVVVGVLDYCVAILVRALWLVRFPIRAVKKINKYKLALLRLFFPRMALATQRVISMPRRSSLFQRKSFGTAVGHIYVRWYLYNMHARTEAEDLPNGRHTLPF